MQPGEAVRLDCVDAAGGQIGPDSTVADLLGRDPDVVNPTTGPVRVEGARPGDALHLTVEEVGAAGWGWTANIPGFGLLADDFPDADLHLWDVPAGAAAADFRGMASVPLRPFIGTAGVAPREAGRHDVIPPRRVGGNLDCRDLVAGARLVLPVEVDGALFSAGDTHLAQGDGEVCGTAIEAPLAVVCRFEVERGAAPAMPRLEVPATGPDPRAAAGWWLTTGVGPDLLAGARTAVREMLALLDRRAGISPPHAYLLSSVCADLRIIEVVDRPHWVVGCAFPVAVLE